ncbi:RNA polymerase II transcriptional coactivator [Orchesella cincta]|uniref:RNA polymerase II transcriptional coactivator n=1 Tax=Orchesella cincta TaxID=48709 RepID=A0A1D2MXD6_ORCCI|nr:RNA polymerase II transcriptional coactivator [Orchesella cincta]
MPKSKSRKLEESSNSDSDSSGPRDRNPPPKKQAKTESSPAKSSGSKPKGGGGSGGSGGGGDHSWTLDKKRVVKINEFRGTVFVDIREYYEKDGEMRPGKKGISLSATQWQKLKEVMSEVDDALKTY